jgi:Family of unknown function (DUF6804)
MGTDASTNISVVVAVSLMVAAATWPASFPYQVAARVVICAMAVMAAVQASRVDRKTWVLGLSAIAVLFNPVFPIGLPRTATLAASVGALIGLITWLETFERAARFEPVARRFDVAP